MRTRIRIAAQTEESTQLLCNTIQETKEPLTTTPSRPLAVPLRLTAIRLSAIPEVDELEFDQLLWNVAEGATLPLVQYVAGDGIPRSGSTSPFSRVNI